MRESATGAGLYLTKRCHGCFEARLVLVSELRNVCLSMSGLYSFNLVPIDKPATPFGVTGTLQYRLPFGTISYV